MSTLTIYEDVEAAIVQRLKPLEALPQIVVEAMPENQAGYNRPTVDAKIWVMYESSEFGTPRSTMVPIKDMGTGVQEETYSYQIMVMARKLRGNNGVYHMTKLIKSRLLGFSPCGLDKMTLVSNRFAPGEEAYKENLFTYILTFATKGLSIEDVSPEELPLLKDVDFDENYPA